ncbi:hypothetical protein ACFU8Q_37960 [Streptomyces sp. NPDC057543]|uniref:hypothetical protein n=1 Tax=Streptomyces sp. NPDC057543 TaxID=3346163 RepID=UPI0036D04F8D
MTGLWRQVLTALNSDQPHDGPGRERLLDLGAAELAHARRAGQDPVTAEDVKRFALREVSVFLDDAQARAALTQRRTTRG